MSLATGEPSTQVFDRIAEYLASESAKQQAIKDFGKIFKFQLNGEGGGQWYVDLKNNGTIVAGKDYVEGESPDITYIVDASDFKELVDDPQYKALEYSFSGKLNVSGDKTLVPQIVKILEMGKK
ncbi:hypothetical protein CB0940_09014 [Cercospora beticola]|uniref:SCP2 domain-containing protein n=1 Tax=Cercospora beticola TaxID=122368 RepID=A0A2G5HHY9_CERBT|nr:hypothetical protein CB0940_09014 [Cercospora beticola]PIA92125.1 hypothetical protein CB0940_09014 [Cercospora beticola]WPB06714.1 hypothetical protein RHO25_011373 [Cercospora beticola]